MQRFGGMDRNVTVILADSARARFFTVQDHRGQAGKTEPQLVEHVDLIQLGRRQRPAEKLSDSRPGTRSTIRSQHTVDDHRDAKTEDGDRQFAVEVMDELRSFCEANKTDDLVIVAPPRFVGHLRASGEPPSAARFVPLELSELTAPRALEHLTKHGYLNLRA